MWHKFVQHQQIYVFSWNPASFVASNSGPCGQYSYFSLFSCRFPPHFLVLVFSCIILLSVLPQVIIREAFPPNPPQPQSYTAMSFLKLLAVRGLPIWKGESGKFLTEIPKDLARDGIRNEKGKHLMYPKNRLQERKAFWKIKCIVTLHWSYFLLKVGNSSA
jgi:hypothetical protein